MTPLAVITLLDLPFLRISIEETSQFTLAAGVIPTDGEVAIIIGYHALLIEIGKN